MFVVATVLSIEVPLRWIPPGRFKIGSPEAEEGRYEDEGPQTDITLARGYWLMDAPVTQALWESVMGENPSGFRSPDRPVEQVSWLDVKGFLKRLNAHLDGVSMRLPSESEWEYACRSGSDTATYAGPMELLGERNAPVLDEIAWYGGNSGREFELDNGADSRDWEEKQYKHEKAGTHPIRQKSANGWGVYDQLGNVWEWCEDVWSENHEGIDQAGKARQQTDVQEEARVVRGGSWSSRARNVRSAFRIGLVPDDLGSDLGFRCVLGQEESGDRGERVAMDRMAEPRP